MENVVIKSFYSMRNIDELSTLTYQYKPVISIIWHQFPRML